MNLKNSAKFLLQKMLGFDNYLYYFSLFKIRTLSWDRNDGQFMHFLSLMPGDGMLLDIGANIGIMTTLMAKSKPGAQVLAFEPVPDNLKALRRVIGYYGLRNVEIASVALGDHEGKVTLLLPEQDHVKFQGLSHVVDATSSAPGNRFDVDCYRLDEYLKKNYPDLPVNAIKIDVENYESKVLRGGMETIHRYRPIVYCELWETQNRAECFSMFEAENYRAFVLERDQLVPFSSALNHHHNFFFLPDKITS